MENKQYANQPGYSNAGHQVVSVSSFPDEYCLMITPKINGAPSPSVQINGAAAAGSRRIDDATPTLSETLAEDITWAFDSTDDIRSIYVSVETEARVVTAISGTGAAVTQAHEVRAFALTINPGDDIQGATRLLNSYPDVHFVRPNHGWVRIDSDVPIISVYGIAKLSDLANPLQGGCRVRCVGVSYA